LKLKRKLQASKVHGIKLLKKIQRNSQKVSMHICNYQLEVFIVFFSFLASAAETML